MSLFERFRGGGSYIRWTRRNRRTFGDRQGLEQAIGGEFEAFGTVQLELLKHYGLRPEHDVVDVGCGSGRLAFPLSRYLTGRYLGLDVVPELLARASALAQRPDWRFAQVERFVIPGPDASADLVCLFSVATHLLHEQTYLYLEEARRVLRPGGLIVMSFLEFRMAFHWDVFAKTVERERRRDPAPLNVFVEREAIRAWCGRLGLAIVDLRDGDDRFVPLPEPVRLEDGRVFEDVGNLGQSICVMRTAGLEDATSVQDPAAALR